MSISTILEVAIGMLFAWLVLSLAVMYIQEWVVGKLGWRSSLLETYVANLLADPALAKQFYEHPLIQGLHSGTDGSHKPSYIPSGQFSTALFDIIRNAPKEASLIQKTLYDLQTDIDQLKGNKRELANQQLNITLDLTRKALASDGGQDMINSMLDEIKGQIRKLSADYPILQPMIESRFTTFSIQKKQIDTILANIQTQTGGNPNSTNLDQIRRGLAVLSVTQPQVKQAVEALLTGVEEYSATGEGTLIQARKNLEGWFDNGMDRLSGWYKRKSQTLAIILGLSVALILNVDSLQLATQLWQDPLVRESLSAQASTFLAQNETVKTPNAQQLAAIETQITQLNIPVGWVGTPLVIDASFAATMPDGTQKTCATLPSSNAQIFGLPLGNKCYPIINAPNFNDLTGWLLKLVGLFISGVAAAQGAPFWFDILKKIINIRTSGTSSDTTQKNAK